MNSVGKTYTQTYNLNSTSSVEIKLTARMLSPDPFVQNTTSTQNFNRYSYFMNNPLKYTDPSGYYYFYDFNGRQDSKDVFAWIDIADGHEGDNISAGALGYKYQDGKYMDKATGEIVNFNEVYDYLIDNEIKENIKNKKDNKNYQNNKNLICSTDKNYIGSNNPVLNALVKYIITSIKLMPPFINPLLGAGAVSISLGPNFIGSDVNGGIIIALNGDDYGEYTLYYEKAGGPGTGISFGGEYTRIDYTGGNENITLDMLEGYRDKIYGGVDAGVSLGIGISFTEWEGNYIIGTSFKFGFGITPFLIDGGYNQGEIIFKN